MRTTATAEATAGVEIASSSSSHTPASLQVLFRVGNGTGNNTYTGGGGGGESSAEGRLGVEHAGSLTMEVVAMIAQASAVVARADGRRLSATVSRAVTLPRRQSTTCRRWLWQLMFAPRSCVAGKRPPA